MQTSPINPKPQTSRWSRERVKRYLVQRFYTRFHMSLILSSSALAAMLLNWSLLQADVHALWVRYPLAVCVAYATFLAGVWLWLRYIGLGERTAVTDSGGNTLIDGVDVSDLACVSSQDNLGPASLILRGSGGQSGGGGASAAWADAESAGSGDTLTEGIAGKLGGFADLDGEGIVLLLLALSLVASIFLLSGYVIWFAPDILGEAAFGAMLSGGLIKSARRHDGEGWVEGVMRKTWWPFAIILLLSLALAIFIALHYPEAHTLHQAVQMALSA